MENLLNTFMNQEVETRPRRISSVRDDISPIKTFENTKKRLESAKTNARYQPIKYRS